MRPRSAWLAALALGLALAAVGVFAPLGALLFGLVVAALPREARRGEAAWLGVALGTHHLLLLSTLLLLLGVWDDVEPAGVAVLWVVCVAGAWLALAGFDLVRGERVLPRALLRGLVVGALMGYAVLAATFAWDGPWRDARGVVAGLLVASAYAPYALGIGAAVGALFAALDVGIVRLARRLRAEPAVHFERPA